MDGWIILDKDSGMFSRSASSRVARLYGTKKSGHIGTLDPMATGVLPIAIGNATKMIPFIEELSDGNKEYLFSLKFGISTDSLDITGVITGKNNKIPSDDEINAILPSFIGGYNQVPPAYSSVHVNGSHSYELARRGVAVDLAPRHIIIHELEYFGVRDNSWHFRVSCGRGTYVRSLVRDIAEKLGTIATVDMIRRTKTNGFSIENAVKLDFLEKGANNSSVLGENLMPIDYGLGDIPVCNLNDKDTLLYKHGGFIDMQAPDSRVRVYNNGEFIGIGAIQENKLRPVRTI